MPTCKLCNKYFKLLNSHICRGHKMTTTEYKKLFGDDTPFMDESVKELKRENGYSPWSVADVMERKSLSIEDATLLVKNKVADTFGRDTSVRCEEYWISKGFTQDQAKEKISSLQVRNLDYFVHKYGSEIGREKYESWRKGIQVSNSKEFMLSNGITGEAIKIMRDNFTVDNLMIKYSIDETTATDMRKSRIKNSVSALTQEYWISKGFTQDQAKEKISSLQVRNLDYFVHKYGSEIGREKYESWVYAATKHSVGKFSSKESQVFFAPFIEYCKTTGIDYVEEKYFSVNGKSYYVDLCLPNEKIIFEYDGEAFHADPENVDLQWRSAKKNLSYDEVLAYDNKKMSDLESIGYRVIRIHSSRKDLFDLVLIFESIVNEK